MLEKCDAVAVAEEYLQLCDEEPNAARRLESCLRGHDVPPTLVQPICDFLESVAVLLDSK